MHKKVKYEDTSGGTRKFVYAKYFDQLETMDENFRKEVSGTAAGNTLRVLYERCFAVSFAADNRKTSHLHVSP